MQCLHGLPAMAHWIMASVPLSLLRRSVDRFFALPCNACGVVWCFVPTGANHHNKTYVPTPFQPRERAGG
ncbi:hypothetical protein DZC30_03205 [Comamonas testosteroni]|uniref:Uncharacterized protein n=1 Tax=Comamonas testosteroni TaxID=285 RepID=A0A373FRK8_COMTE|nr:hypothetical protein DZC30_03205 [Comamonas testosteroni]